MVVSALYIGKSVSAGYKKIIVLFLVITDYLYDYSEYEMLEYDLITFLTSKTITDKIADQCVIFQGFCFNWLSAICS